MKGSRDPRTITTVPSAQPKAEGLRIPGKRVEVSSPHYFEKLPILPGNCQFTDFGDECSTIFNFKCEARAPRTVNQFRDEPKCCSKIQVRDALMKDFSNELDLFE